jgi:hypothetical protein
MQKRILYSILFGVPGLVLALEVAWLVAALTAGILWLAVYGDDPWPASINTPIFVLLALVFLTVWLSLAAIGFMVGKLLEKVPGLNKSHILVSAGVTLALILLILFQQGRIGNIGARSESTLCSNYCSQNGYNASSLPARNTGDRSCSCLDAVGHAVLTVPLDSLAPPK